MKHIFFSGRSASASYGLMGIGCWLLLAACQAPAPPLKRQVQCYVRFDAARGQVQAEATIQQVNGPSPGQPVEMPGGIMYQNTPMQVMAVQGLSYRRTYAADFVPEHTFSWADAQGVRQKVSFPMASIARFGFGEGPLLRSKPATLRWEGGPLEKGEALVLMWENRALQQTMPMELIRTGGDASIEFPAAKLAELPPGRWTLYLVRKRLVKTDAPGMAAEAVLEYYSKSDTIEVK